MDSFAECDDVSAAVISAPHAVRASCRSAVIMLLWDAVTSILCLLIWLSAERRLGRCFRDVLVKAETDIKEGIKQAPLCGDSAMNDLFRFICFSAGCSVTGDRLITANNAFILRTHTFTSACGLLLHVCCLSPSDRPPLHPHPPLEGNSNSHLNISPGTRGVQWAIKLQRKQGSTGCGGHHQRHEDRNH